MLKRCPCMHARNLLGGAFLATSMLLWGCAGPTVLPECPSPGPAEPAPPLDSEAPAPAPSPDADHAPAQRGSPSLTESTPRLGATPAAKPHAFDSLTGSLSPGFQSSYEDFLVAELALSHASDACSDACRALRSMVRAAERMCAIASSEREADRCEAARGRVHGAREHIRRACHVCPEGPPLEESE
jgi:hypothetical protein